MTERTVLVRLRANVSDFNRAMMGARSSVQGLTKDIDTSSNRTSWLAQGLLAIGPTLSPIGAAGVPIIAGLATQLGLAAVAAGTVALGFQGIGDAVKAVNTYQLEPTAANLEKMQLAMEKLGTDGAGFVRFLDDVASQLSVLQRDSRAGMFPGFEMGISRAMNQLDMLRTIVVNVSEAMGQIGKEAGTGINNDSFTAFFRYLETDAKPILIDMGRTLGNFVEGIANLVVAFGPITRSFSGGFLEMSRSFSEWSRNLDDNSSFQTFLQYAEESLPKVGHLIGSLVDTFVALARAAAPVGDVVLPALSSLLEVVAKFLDTPFGSLFISLGAAAGIYGRAVNLARITTGGLGSSWVAAALNAKAFGKALSTVGQPMQVLANTGRDGAMNMGMFNSWLPKTTTGLRGVAKAAVPAGANMAIIGATMTGLPEKLGLTNTAMGAMIGMMGGPWGAAVGASIGLVMDLAAGHHQAAVDVSELTASYDQNTGAITENTRAKAVQKAQSSGLLDDAQALGINLDLVTEAILGNKAAQDSLNATLAQYPVDYTITSAEDMKQSFSDQEIAATLAARAATHLRDGLPGLAGQFFTASKDAKQFAAGMGGVEDAADDASNAVSSFRSQVERANRVLDRRGSLRDYQAALDDFTQAVKDNGKTLDINTPKGRAVQDALDGIASSALKAAENLKKSDRPAFLRQARADFVDAAEKLGMTTARAKDLATELGLVDKKKAHPSVDMNTSAFDAKAASVAARLAALDGKEAVTFITTVIRTRTEHTQTRAEPHVADGGLILGPGGPRDDKIPAWLSNREFVMSNKAVEKYGVAMFHRLNTLSFADGGAVTPTRSSGGDGGHLDKAAMDKQREAILAAIQKFTLDVDSTVSQFRQAFERLQKRITDAGGRWTTALARDAERVDHLAEKYRKLQNRLDEQNKALEALQSQYDDITGQRTQLESNVAGVFSTSVTGGGIAGLDKALKGDIKNRTTMDSLLAALRAAGLDSSGPQSGLYAELAQSGDIKTAQQLLAGGPGAINQYESLYARRDVLNQQSAAAQGELAFGAMQDALTTALTDQQAAIDRTTDGIHDTKVALRQELKGLRDDLHDIVPKKIGDEVGDALTSTTSRARDRGRRRP